MLKILFFARIREQLQCGDMTLPWREEIASLDSLQAELCRLQGEKWSEVLGQENVIRAVNQQVAEGDSPLEDGDEVAFFPPVTGG